MADVFGVLFFYPIRGVQCLNDTEERTIEPRQSRTKPHSADDGRGP